MKKLLLILAATAATLFSAAVLADDYPSRPIMWEKMVKDADIKPN